MDIKKYEPLWGRWAVGELIGKGSFGSVYRCTRSEFGDEFVSAVKIISIPQDKEEIDNARREGMDQGSLKNYFSDIATDFLKEIRLMNSLKGLTNVVSIEDYLVEQHDDGIGWDILIRMEYLTSLNEYMGVRNLTAEDVVRIGIDISRAIEQCHEENIIHRDIKPDNIFVNKRGNFKLGDFGIARQLERTKMSLSQKGTYSYMAPEIYKGQHYDVRVDIYSLGLVLYRLLNNNRLPFLPPYPEAITYRSREDSLARRLAGEELPSLENTDAKLSKIVLKACAFDADERHQTPGELKAALEGVSTGFERPSVAGSLRTDRETLGIQALDKQADKTEGMFSREESEEASEIEMYPRNEVYVGAARAGDETVGMFSRQSANSDQTIGLFSKPMESQMTLLSSIVGCRQCRKPFGVNENFCANCGAPRQTAIACSTYPQKDNRLIKSPKWNAALWVLAFVFSLTINIIITSQSASSIGFGHDVNWLSVLFLFGPCIIFSLVCLWQNKIFAIAFAIIELLFVGFVLISTIVDSINGYFFWGDLLALISSLFSSFAVIKKVYGDTKISDKRALICSIIGLVFSIFGISKLLLRLVIFIFCLQCDGKKVFTKVKIKKWGHVILALALIVSFMVGFISAEREMEGYELTIQILSGREAIIRLTDPGLQSKYEGYCCWTVHFGEYAVEVSHVSQGGYSSIKSVEHMDSTLWRIEDRAWMWLTEVPFSVNVQTIEWVVTMPDSVRYFSFYDIDGYIAEMYGDSLSYRTFTEDSIRYN